VWVRSFIDLELPDLDDSVVPFKHTTPISQNKKDKIKEQNSLIRLIKEYF